MDDRQAHRIHASKRTDQSLRAICLLAVLATGGWASALAYAGVVFDGSIGPNAAGTERTGSFEIAQQDGKLAGANLFHSFSSFGVSQGEMATFTHQSSGIEHIIARITGHSPSAIHGTVQVRRAAGDVLSPTGAALWLMNPSGIVIGEGASFDAQSTFVLSTANRLGFANGDNFYSHEHALSSVLSIADPTSFGFLDRQALPAQVNPRGISVALTRAAGTNEPLFLADMTLVGTSIDPGVAGVQITGDLAQAFDPSAVFAPGESTQLQSTKLALAALGAGASINIDNTQALGLTAEPHTALGNIVIQNANLLVADAGIAQTSGFSVLGANLLLDNAYVDAFAVSQPVPISIRAIESVLFLDSVLRTSTLSASDGGDLRIDTANYGQLGGLVSSRNLDLGAATGDPGNVLFGTSASLPMENFLLQQGQIVTFSTRSSQAGDLLLNVQNDLALIGSPEDRVTVASVSTGGGSSGDILVAANSIRAENSDFFSAGINADGQRVINLQAGSGGMALANTSLFGVADAGRAGASIGLFSDADLSLASPQGTSIISTGTSGDSRGGDIFIAAGESLLVQGSFDISSNSLGSGASSGEGGIVSISGRHVELLQPDDSDTATSISSLTSSAGAGGTIFVAATEDLVIRGRHDLSSITIGAGDSGAVIVDAGSISIESVAPSTLSTSSFGSGDAGIVSLNAHDQLLLSGVAIDSVAADEGAAGFLLLSAAFIAIDGSTLLTTTSASDIQDTPAQIFMDAGDTLRISESTLQSNSIGLAPAGQVSLAAGKLLEVNNVSIQTATTSDGVTGSIFLTSGGDILLRGANTELLSNSLGNSTAGDVSVLAADTLLFEGGGFIQTSAVGSGDAGTILLAADRVRLRLARIEGTAENAGGGDVNIFGRDIHLDGDLAAGGIVFISASSESSDADGNGGSITLGNPLAPAELVFVRNSGLSASANAGSGGRININAQHFLRDARSIFQVTSTLGEAGSLEINAPEQDISAALSELDVAILDATDLIRDPCAASPEDASSLVLVGQGAIAESYEGYLSSGFQPSAATQTSPEHRNGGTARSTGKQPQAGRMEGECSKVH